MNNIKLYLIKRIKYNRLVRDSSWAIIGTSIGSGLSFISGIIIARLLGSESFGEYGVIKNTLLTVSVFATFGLGYTSTKYVAEYKKEKPEHLWLILKYSRIITLCVSLFMSIIIIVLARYISESILSAPHLERLIQFTSLLIVARSITTTQIGVLAGLGAFKSMARINSIIGIGAFFLSLSFTVAWGLIGALYALLITQIFNCYLNFRQVNKELRDNRYIKEVAYNKDLFMEILRFSFPVAIQEVTYSVARWLTILLIINYTSYKDLGIYSAAIQWYSIILFIPGILRNVALSHLSSADDNIKHWKVLKTLFIFNFVSTVIPAVLLIILSDYIIILYGDTYSGIKEVIIIAAICTVFSGLSNVYAQAYMSKNLNWLMLYIRIVRDLSVLIISYILLTNNIFQSGSISVMYAMLTSEGLFLIFVSILYNTKAYND